jgi:creatinine amidohydrolase/Fe(II)-dependent formamide hydrolase-like protein
MRTLHTRRASTAAWLIISSLAFATLAAQRPADAPKTAPGGTPPDTVFLEDLTWAEVRDLVRSGTTTVIVPTAGTEQKGPHMAVGEHKFVLAYTADRIARALGRTLVAPIITYVPEGTWDPPTGHMTKPGTITLPDDRFVELLVHAGRSLKAGGFTTILFIGESGGNRSGMRQAAARLTEMFAGSARAFWIDDYYTKSHADQRAYITKTLGIAADRIGGHANIQDTSELLFVAPQHVRTSKIAPGGGYDDSGVSGDPTKATAELGRIFVQMKIDNAVAQARALMAGSATAPASNADPNGGGTRARQAASRGETAAGPARPTFETAPAGTPSAAPDTVFIEELTWEETRDALKSGTRIAIVPIGGTEKNGYHMILGKHNYIVTRGAEMMARRLKNALVAPTIQYVPEGDPDRAQPGVLSLPSPAYDGLLDAAARSLQAHGFADILFIGDSGGNQAGMRAVADALNAEWKDRGARVYALTDYYERGREHYRAWMLAAFGYDDTVIGSHAGISDTSQLLFVHPAGIRTDRIQPWGGAADSGVSGDPTKATAEIGRMGMEFKVNAAIAQYRALKEPPRPRRGGGPGASLAPGAPY